uniref:Uncharacterized protein n=1 Tax=Rhizophora mucronata TaxID=61149 RepID=A0A2P2MGF9_RHIMU
MYKSAAPKMGNSSNQTKILTRNPAMRGASRAVPRFQNNILNLILINHHSSTK